MLWFLFIPRANLSPFTKDYRGEEQINEPQPIFASYFGRIINNKQKNSSPSISLPTPVSRYNLLHINETFKAVFN